MGDLGPAPESAASSQRAARMASARLQREARTIAAMLRIHCRDHHAQHGEHLNTLGLCEPCARLHEYALKRLAGCPFGPGKPTCSRCVIHCYGPRQREAVREVMRYAGPRMLLRHPVLAIAHLLDKRRAAPPKPHGPGQAGSR